MKQKRDDMAQSILNALISEKISHNDIITGDELLVNPKAYN